MKIYKQKSAFMVGLGKFKKDFTKGGRWTVCGLVLVGIGLTFFIINPGGMCFWLRFTASLMMVTGFGFNPILISFVACMGFASPKKEWRDSELPKEGSAVVFWSQGKRHKGIFDGYYFRATNTIVSYGLVSKYKLI